MIVLEQNLPFVVGRELVATSKMVAGRWEFTPRSEATVKKGELLIVRRMKGGEEYWFKTIGDNPPSKHLLNMKEVAAVQLGVCAAFVGGPPLSYVSNRFFQHEVNKDALLCLHALSQQREVASNARCKRLFGVELPPDRSQPSAISDIYTYLMLCQRDFEVIRHLTISAYSLACKNSPPKAPAIDPETIECAKRLLPRLSPYYSLFILGIELAQKVITKAFSALPLYLNALTDLACPSTHLSPYATAFLFNVIVNNSALFASYISPIKLCAMMSHPLHDGSYDFIEECVTCVADEEGRKRRRRTWSKDRKRRAKEGQRLRLEDLKSQVLDALSNAKNGLSASELAVVLRIDERNLFSRGRKRLGPLSALMSVGRIINIGNGYQLVESDIQ